jgi:hypothetical protein
MNKNNLRVFMKNAFVPFVQLSEETTIIFYTALISWPILVEKGLTVYCQVRTKLLSICLVKFPLQAISLRLLTLDVHVPSLESI